MALLPLVLLVALGAGCSSPPVPDAADVPVGEWFLTFDNGDTWYPHLQYWAAGSDFSDVVIPSYKREQNRIWIQNVNEPINPDYITQYKEDYDYYEGDDWILIDATVFPKPAASFPDSGVVTETIGDKTFATRTSGGGVIYYWQTDAHVYELMVITPDGRGVRADDLMATIQERESVAVQ